MRRTSALSRAAIGALAMLCFGGIFGGITGPLAADTPSRWTLFAPTETHSSPFRLGNAAQPFGWSTAIGDLNADGRPDYAVADRVGRGALGFEYSLQFSVSGLASQTVTFDSPDAALRVSLRDVDHDQDLDLVVSTVLSPEATRVWLNNGRGVFSESRAAMPSSAWRDSPAADGENADNPDAVADTTPRRADHALVRAGPVDVTLTAVRTSSGDAAPRLAPHAVRRPPARAPPAFLPLFL